MTGRKTKSPKGKVRKNEILDTAEELFQKKGFINTSVGEIIKALGLSSGAIYHHFPKKESILKAIAERQTKRLQAEMEKWIQDDSLTPTEKITLFLKRIDTARKMRLTTDYIKIGVAREDREIHETVVQLSLEHLSQQLSTIIEQGIESGEFQVDHPKATAVTMILLLSEFIHRAGRVQNIVKWKEMHGVLTKTIHAMLGIKNS